MLDKLDCVLATFTKQHGGTTFLDVDKFLRSKRSVPLISLVSRSRPMYHLPLITRGIAAFLMYCMTNLILNLPLGAMLRTYLASQSLNWAKTQCCSLLEAFSLHRPSFFFLSDNSCWTLITEASFHSETNVTEGYFYRQ